MNPYKFPNINAKTHEISSSMGYVISAICSKPLLKKGTVPTFNKHSMVNKRAKLCNFKRTNVKPAIESADRSNRAMAVSLYFRYLSISNPTIMVKNAPSTVATKPMRPIIESARNAYFDFTAWFNKVETTVSKPKANASAWEVRLKLLLLKRIFIDFVSDRCLL